MNFSDIMKKLTFTPSYKYMNFPLFWLILISFFCPNYVKPFFVDSQAMYKTIMIIIIIIIIINVKSFLERL